MTIILTPTRALSQSLLSRSHHLLARASLSTNPLLRVSCNHASASQASNSSSSFSFEFTLPYRSRTYATAASAKPLGRPKGHTGRTPAKRTKPSTAAEPGAKKTVKKPRAKKAKAKPRVKSKPKPRKKAVSASAQKKAVAKKARDLKEKALLKSPKALPATAWTILFSESATKGQPIDGTSAGSAAQKYKNLTPEEHERYNHTANQNKEKNATAYKRWLSTFTPLQIKEANNARNELKRQAKKDGKKTVYKHIQDDRLVKQPINAYSYFLSARVASGDMKNMKISEIGGLVAREWKGLGAAEKKTFEDQAAKDKNRYLEEYKTVYGEEPAYRSKKK